MAQGKKFGGVRYYHRHAEGGPESRASLDWREHQVNMGRQRRKRIAGVTLVVVLTGALVVLTFVFLLR